MILTPIANYNTLSGPTTIGAWVRVKGQRSVIESFLTCTRSDAKTIDVGGSPTQVWARDCTCDTPITDNASINKLRQELSPTPSIIPPPSPGDNSPAGSTNRSLRLPTGWLQTPSQTWVETWVSEFDKASPTGTHQGTTAKNAPCAVTVTAINTARTITMMQGQRRMNFAYLSEETTLARWRFDHVNHNSIARPVRNGNVLAYNYDEKTNGLKDASVGTDDVGKLRKLHDRKVVRLVSVSKATENKDDAGKTAVFVDDDMCKLSGLPAF